VLTRSSDQQFEELRDGLRDVAVTAMDNVIHWNRRQGGGDFRIVAQVEADTGNTLVAAPGIGSIAERTDHEWRTYFASSVFTRLVSVTAISAGTPWGLSQVACR
jgi:hypothetical protein